MNEKFLSDSFGRRGLFRRLPVRLILWVFLSVCVIFPAQSLELQQERIVSGNVTDHTGTTLPGVNVSVKGTTNGTITDSQGFYFIKVLGSSATLVFSYVGFVTREIEAGNRTVINVALVEDVRTIGEIVVVGYGSQRKKDLTGAIASVSGENLGKTPSLSFDQSLQGKVAGVLISQTNGAPGGNVNVLVRGISSITGGNSPLYVIDGFPVGTGGGGSDLSGFSTGSYTSSAMAGNTTQKINPLSDINPNDIESIEILKDASATAIYGSRGSNGVVIITTKKGSSGKTNMEVNVSYGMQQVAKKIKLMNPREFAAFVAEGRDNAWIYASGFKGSASDPNEIRTVSSTWVRPSFRDPSQFPLEGIDWQDVIFRLAPVQNYRLSATGGTEKMKYLISGGYFNQEGIVIGSDYQRFNMRSNLDVQLTDRIKLGSIISASYGYGDFARTEGHLQFRSIIQCALASSPTLAIYDENGNPQNELTDPLGVPVENPLNIDRYFSDKRDQANLLTNNYLEINILNGLVFKTSVGVNYSAGQTKLWKSSNIAQGQSTTSPATAGVHSRKSLNWLNENTLNYQNTFNERHYLNVLAGLTAQKDNFNLLSVGATDFPTDYVTYVSAGTVNAGTNYDSGWSLVSLLARVNYVYDDRYLLTATVRRDGSSRFGKQNKWGTFPSISFGYRLSEEDFMKEQHIVSNLKIRASYGEAGNNLIGNYAHIGLLSSSNYVTGSAKAPGLVISSMSNDALTWEKSKQINVGLDFGLFEERIRLTADIYRDYKDNLLLAVNLPAASGFSSSVQNIGAIENKGMEMVLNTINTDSKDFRWDTNITFSLNRNEVKKLATEGARITNSSVQVTEVGYPIGSFYLMKVLGVFKDEADVKSGHPLQHPQTQPGDLKFKDVDNNGTITVNDKEIVGDPWPDYTWGLGNIFAYRNLSLNIFITGSHGGDVYMNVGETLLNSAGVQNQLDLVNRRWKSPSDPGDGLVPRAIRNNYALGMQPSSRLLFDGSFVRIKEVTLSCDFPKSITKHVFRKGLNAYFNISNLYTFTGYPGYDPEASSTGDAVTKSGFDEGVYPLARTFTLGLKMAF
ncbi:MAG: TonB-dependent receptor [Tannerella sp.]|jgi:TonB-linked SusC/RagA family outer membrane protein|nr:TonB-dependent receptor [Tannerella sp.]